VLEIAFGRLKSSETSKSVLKAFNLNNDLLVLRRKPARAFESFGNFRAQP
jgi:hypothetical protein